MTILPFGAKQAVCISSQGRFSNGTTTDSILHRRWWRTVSLQNVKEKLVAMVIPLMRRRKELPDFQKSTASRRRSGTPKSPKLRRRQRWRFSPAQTTMMFTGSCSGNWSKSVFKSHLFDGKLLSKWSFCCYFLGQLEFVDHFLFIL